MRIHNPTVGNFLPDTFLISTGTKEKDPLDCLFRIGEPDPSQGYKRGTFFHPQTHTQGDSTKTLHLLHHYTLVTSRNKHTQNILDKNSVCFILHNTDPVSSFLPHWNRESHPTQGHLTPSTQPYFSQNYAHMCWIYIFKI